MKEKSMVRKLEPLNDRIVVKANEQEQQTTSGIYIPDTAQERPQEGKVIAVGPGRIDDNGKRIPMEVAKGDSIIYSKYGGTEFKEDGEEYLIMREADVLAKIG
jgi:chaperonin GroES